METRSTTPLQALFQAIAQVQHETELRQPIMAKLGEYFSANRWRLWFMSDCWDDNKEPPIPLKQALSLEFNPVLRYLVQRHTAVHDEVILPPGVWQTICPMVDHGHVMVGPVISEGQLIGGIAFTRRRGERSFNADNLADLSALSLHVSTRLAALRSQPAPQPRVDARLTPREMQISKLVAQGLTNRKVGEALWITENSVKQALKRMFRKLGVSSRAEMVAQLAIKTARQSSSRSAST